MHSSDKLYFEAMLKKFLPSVFSPLQSVLVNPDNLAPGSRNDSDSSVSSYFTDPAVLDNLPPTMLTMAAIYAILSIIGVSLTVGPPVDEKSMASKKLSLKQRLIAAGNYFFSDPGRNADFYLLWLARFLYLTVGAGVLTHWKTFSFTQSDDDQIISIAGGIR